MANYAQIMQRSESLNLPLHDWHFYMDKMNMKHITINHTFEDIDRL